jgi:hypothetical protein
MPSRSRRNRILITIIIIIYCRNTTIGQHMYIQYTEHRIWLDVSFLSSRPASFHFCAGRQHRIFHGKTIIDYITHENYDMQYVKGEVEDGGRKREDHASRAPQPHPERIDGGMGGGWLDNSPGYGLSFVSYPHTGERGKKGGPANCVKINFSATWFLPMNQDPGFN